MKILLAVSLCYFLNAAAVRATNMYYVWTGFPRNASCPGRSCTTLSGYALRSNSIPSNSILSFLPGYHRLEDRSLTLRGISNITLRGEDSQGSAHIVCFNTVTIKCENVLNFTIEGLSFIINIYEPYSDVNSALYFINSVKISISGATFKGSTVYAEDTGQAINLKNTSAIIQQCLFKDNVVFDNGGAISLVDSSVTIYQSNFTNNAALEHNGYGGAIYGTESMLSLHGRNQFSNNYATDEGGAISCFYCTILVRGQLTFHDNRCGSNNSQGGALALNTGDLNASATIDFSANRATIGGAFFMAYSRATFSGDVALTENSATTGGAMYIELQSRIMFTGHTSFDNNTATEGGSVYIALTSEATFGGKTAFTNNMATYGGGMLAESSTVIFQSDCVFSNNRAHYGSAIYTLQGEVYVEAPLLFTMNSAGEDGGAVYAVGTKLLISHLVNFTLNTAHNGGAMYLDGATLNIGLYETTVFSFSNSARQYGGFIHHQDSITNGQCRYQHDINDLKRLPNCFVIIESTNLESSFISSDNDSAGADGDVFFGGLLDRCRIDLTADKSSGISLMESLIRIQPHTNTSISSAPYELCICNEHQISACDKTLEIEVYRGQMFEVPLLARAQVGTTSTTVTAVISSGTGKLETSQASQVLHDYCHPLPYTVYSTDSYQEVVLYPDGPCRDTGAAKVVVKVYLLPCPDGFRQDGEICTCEDRLQDYAIKCTIPNGPFFTKSAGSNFWMGAQHVNTSYEGLILARSCPAEYCKRDTVSFTLENSDDQCDLNHTGLLCGTCATNHSLMLGSSQCQVCSNTYLSLLLLFTVAGLALVVFLTSLRLTVATGTLNCIILYADIVQANKSLFLASGTRNILTVFLAWLNLDFGFKVCFYDGLDAYALTWLQFVFPLYVWLIIGLMIFISRYSITVSKLIGSNPVAVLATLLLMSYTKILKIIIEVYSSAELDYPYKKDTVWLKDANVSYLQSRHLVLTLVTSLVLIFLFLPYTLLLLLGHKLYPFTGKKYCRWLIKLIPLLDSYYAPYKIHTRYWTGFLLLIRCALYVVFLRNFLSPSKIFAAIAITFSLLVCIVGFVHSGQVYKKLYINMLEGGIYMNLVVHSVAALAGLNSAALAYSLVGSVFAATIILSALQFHHVYISKTAMWLKLKNKFTRRKKDAQEDSSDAPHAAAVNTSHDPHKLVTKTVIELREPLLEN